MDGSEAPFLESGIAIVIAGLVYYVLKWIGIRAIRRLSAQGPEAAARWATLWVMIKRIILVTVVIILVLVLLEIWGVGLAPFIAVGAAAAAAIGFGAQDVVKDLLAGFFILAEDQFHIGDTITIAGTTGTVEDIQFRVTVLRDLQGIQHFVPNGQITVTSNYTAIFAQPLIEVDIAYGEQVDAAMVVMEDELNRLAEDPAWAEHIRGEVEMMGVDSLGDSGVTLRARMTTVADERWTIRREAFRRIKNRFDSESIEIPFPQVTIHQPRD